LRFDQQAGDVLGDVGDGVLHRQQFEQIAPVHREQHAARQMVAQLVLDLVGLMLLGKDLVLLHFDLSVIVLDHCGEQRRHFGNALDDHAHVLLQRLERRLAKQRRHGVGG
jgi:hypothetical protein